MTNRVLALVLALMMTVTAMPWSVMAATYSGDLREKPLTKAGESVIDDCQYTISDGQVTITGYTGSAAEVEIPGTIEGYPVTAIGGDAFYKSSSLKAITIPESITSITGNAFWNCKSLTAVHISDLAAWCRIYIGGTDANPLFYAHNLYLNGELVTDLIIPDDITEIQAFAFNGCSSLQSITIHKGITYIGYSAFWGCDQLTGIWVAQGNPYYSCDANGVLFDKKKTVLIQAPAELSGSYTIPDSVKKVESTAFSGCGNLISLTIPDSVTDIDDFAFAQCSNLTTVEMSQEVCEIKTSLFQGCESLTAITLGSYISAIGSHAFQGCSNLTEIIIPDSVAEIGFRAFQDCSSLTSVVIPDSVTYLGFDVFYNCTGLTSISIGKGISSIADSMFYGCSSLTSVTIPAHITEIEWDAFSCCSSLAEIIFEGNAPTISDYAFQEVTATAYYPAENNTWTKYVMWNYGGSLTWVPYETEEPAYGGLEYTISDDQVTITGYTGSASELEIPGIIEDYPVTAIGERAFRNCTSLVTVTIPESVTQIGDSAFDWCYNLTSVNIPQNVTTIGAYAFAWCSSLTEIMLPESIATIKEYAFAWCTGLQSITIPSSVTTIGEYAFGSTGLKTITIPDSVTTMGDWVFASCFELTGIWVDADNTSYSSDEAGVLLNKEQTTLLAAPGALVERYTIPASVTSITSLAFSGCANLTELTIPVSVTHISDWAFDGCNGLTTVNYQGTEADKAEITIEDGNECLLMATWYYAAAAFIPGDLDCDEDVDSDDAIHLLLHSFYPWMYPIDQNGDLDGDGDIDSDDAIQLLLHSFYPDLYPLYNS